MKLLKSLFFSRMTLLSFAVLIQLSVLIIFMVEFNNFFPYFYLISSAKSLIIVFKIVNNNSNPAFKIAWVIPILIFPIFGGIFYIFFGTTRFSKRIKRRMIVFIDNKLSKTLLPQDYIIDEMSEHSSTAANQSRYIQNNSQYPPYINTKTVYLSSGEIKFEKLKEEMEKAEHYIFLEYFIIAEGTMWNELLAIMIKKVKQGVDVRVIYDDVGCLKTLPYRYHKRLEALGIKCAVFNPFFAILSPWFNHRDHRKIAVIDGHTGFTGGVNLADEYINARDRFGHWKDSAIMLKGDAAWSLTAIFLSMWSYLRSDAEEIDFYKPKKRLNMGNDGFVQPFGDSPIDDEAIGEAIYLNVINKAEKYVYINTPYLIIDNKMFGALSIAAKSGVDVRIVTPYIADKLYVHEVTRSFYGPLLESGVKIYEYTPGFNHSKSFVVDDLYGVIGTVNLDFRSLFFHFECGVWMYKSQSIIDMKDDFIKTLDECKQIHLIEYKKTGIFRKLIRFMLRVFAPLM